MADYSLSGIHVINNFVWARLQSVLGWTTILDAGSGINLVPIVVAQQQPELTNSDKPFIVYSYAPAGRDNSLGLQMEQAAYVVYSENETEIRSAINYLVDLLDRQDWTAANINDYIRGLPANTFNNRRKVFEFKNVEVLSAGGPEEAVQEGGRQSGSIVIRYQYTVDQDVTHFSGMRV